MSAEAGGVSAAAAGIGESGAAIGSHTASSTAESFSVASPVAEFSSPQISHDSFGGTTGIPTESIADMAPLTVSSVPDISFDTPYRGSFHNLQTIWSRESTSRQSLAQSPLSEGAFAPAAEADIISAKEATITADSETTSKALPANAEPSARVTILDTMVQAIETIKDFNTIAETPSKITNNELHNDEGSIDTSSPIEESVTPVFDSKNIEDVKAGVIITSPHDGTAEISISAEPEAEADLTDDPTVHQEVIDHVAIINEVVKNAPIAATITQLGTSDEAILSEFAETVADTDEAQRIVQQIHEATERDVKEDEVLAQLTDLVDEKLDDRRAPKPLVDEETNRNREELTLGTIHYIAEKKGKPGETLVFGREVAPRLPGEPQPEPVKSEIVRSSYSSDGSYADFVAAVADEEFDPNTAHSKVGRLAREKTAVKIGVEGIAATDEEVERVVEGKSVDPYFEMKAA